ncbi:MAG: hypothetical protein L0Z55_05765, partial [Planctomycetes bacterium]|nr:hypothetical protein [Planctomycetota bacterium]
MQREPLPCAQIVWDGPGLPRSRAFDDIYYSGAGGAGEAAHVFLGGNGLPARWRGCREFTIVEAGFGTGLNFLATLAAWEAHAPREATLYYISIEGFPLRAEDARRALAAWPALAAPAAELVSAWPPPATGIHERAFAGGRVRLAIVQEEMAEALPLVRSLVPARGADAWYLH